MKPLSDEWTSYSGDLTGKRYSALKLVNTTTVKNLSLKWITPLNQGCGPNGTGSAFGPGPAAAGGGGGGGRGGGGGGPSYPIVVGGLGNGDANTCGAGAHRRRGSVGRRHALRGVAQQRLCGRRARWGRPLAQLLEVARRHDDRHARARHAGQHDLFLAARRLGRRARRQDRQGGLAARGRAVRPAVLLVERADADQRPSARRHRQRPGCAGLPEVARSANGRGAVDLVCDAAEGGRSRPRDLGEPGRGAARQRRHVDSRRLRSGDQALHLRHRQPDAVVHDRPRRRRQPVHVVARRAERRHRQDGVVLPDLAARHA